MKELTNFVIYLVWAIKDFTKHTDPKLPEVAGLWKEAYDVITVTRNSWVSPLARKLENYHWQAMGPGGRFVALRGSDAIDIATLMNRLNKERRRLLTYSTDWWEKYPKVFSDRSIIARSPKAITARPITEILFHALLLTQQKSATSTKAVLEAMGGRWIDKQTSNDFKGFDEIPESFSGKVDEASPIGSPRCLVALFTGSLLTTGTTKPTWGQAMYNLVVTTADYKTILHDYVRGWRIGRYTDKEQLILNALVNRNVDYFHEELERLTQTPGFTKGFKPSQLKEIVAFKMQDSKRDRLPPCLKKADPNQYGQAYFGSNLAFKKKCHFCESHYVYTVAVRGTVPPVEHESTLPELTTVREFRGCCAEALAWIQSIHLRRLFHMLQNELPEVSAIIKAAQKKKATQSESESGTDRLKKKIVRKDGDHREAKRNK